MPPPGPRAGGRAGADAVQVARRVESGQAAAPSQSVRVAVPRGWPEDSPHFLSPRD